MSVQLVFDTRETKLINLFGEMGVKFEIKQLDLGDILVVYNVNSLGETSTIIIERKTFTDLQASLKDGRYHEQKSRYLSLPKGSVIYILENNDPKFETLGKKQFWGMYIHTIIRDSISVFLSSSLEETGNIIKGIMETIEKFGWGGKCSLKDSQVKKKKIEKDNVYLAQLCCFPGISSSKAKLIADVYPNLTDLINVIHNNKFKVKGIGPKILEKIKDGLKLTKTNKTTTTEIIFVE